MHRSGDRKKKNEVKGLGGELIGGGRRGRRGETTESESDTPAGKTKTIIKLWPRNLMTRKDRCGARFT